MIRCMARPSLLRLSEADQGALLQAAASSPDADFRDACRAVLLLGTGSSLQAVGKQFGVHRATIERWAARYRHRGLEGLRGPERDARGRPPKLQVQHLRLLKQGVRDKRGS